MKKTNEFVKVVMRDGKTQKKTVYVDESGEKYVYIYRGYMKLSDFMKGWKII